MTKSQLEKILQLRLIIGYLGEQSQFNWWSTSFLTPASKNFLSPMFPKTLRLTQYQGVKESALKVHDASVGVGKVFHLYRLPDEIEQGLYDLALEPKLTEIIFDYLSSKESVLNELDRLADNTRIKTEGPVAVGKITSFSGNDYIKKISQFYSGAFGAGIRTFPYLTS